MNKLFKTGLGLSLFFILATSQVYASENIAGSSATLKSSPTGKSLEKNIDERDSKLYSFLEKHRSPLVDSTKTFIAAADENGLDWRLLPAIAGVESTFGKKIPSHSFNPFGWGIYQNNVLRFRSFNEGIETVANGLGTKYPEEIEAIARIYCPVNRYKWAGGVNYFMKEIENSPESVEFLSLNI